jgi:manganese/iron transport system permease protein
VVLAGSFAVGVLVLSSRPGASKDLSAFLVGQILTVTAQDITTTVVLGAALLVVLAAVHKELVHGAFDPAGQRAMGYPRGVLDLVVLVVITAALVTVVPAVGTLLSVALLTVPALAARQWVDRVGPMMALAAVIGAGCGLCGLCLSALWDIAAGGSIALTAAAAFLVSALARWGRASLMKRERPAPPARPPASARATVPQAMDTKWW